jgi:hypothetical protein
VDQGKLRSRRLRGEALPQHPALAGRQATQRGCPASIGLVLLQLQGRRTVFRIATDIQTVGQSLQGSAE